MSPSIPANSAADFLMACADDERWRQHADVIIHREESAAPLRTAAATLSKLPGCAMVAVPFHRNGFVVAVRGRPSVIIVVGADADAFAAAFYSVLVSLVRSESALGSATWS